MILPYGHGLKIIPADNFWTGVSMGITVKSLTVFFLVFGGVLSYRMWKSIRKRDNTVFKK